jgi:protein arginine kinase
MPKKKSNTPDIFSQPGLWQQNDGVVKLLSLVTIQRNIDSFKFPGKLTIDQRKQILGILEGELLQIASLDHPKLLPAEGLSPLEKEYLFEHFMGIESLHQAHAGEGFLVDLSGRFLAICNIRNHLQMQIISHSNSIDDSVQTLLDAERKLSQGVSFAFSERYGYLTANPFQCGTALSITSFLQVPALIHAGKLDSLIAACREDGIDVTGIQGDPRSYPGGIILLHNHYTLGVAEQAIISVLRGCVSKVESAELSLQRELAKDDDSSAKDHVSRAFGILNHCYQIETMDALDALSALKLGAGLKWITGVTVSEINALTLKCRRAHLTVQLALDETPDDHAQRRAQFLRKGIEKARLAL